jgi:hypothetical protein
MSDTVKIVSAFPEGPPPLLHDGEGAVLIHPHTGLQYRLNATAASMWEGLREPTAVAGLHDRLARSFDGTPAELTEAVDAFVLRMCELGLVELRDERDAVAAMRRRYLDLLKRALVNLIYPEHELRIDYLEQHGAGGDRLAHQRALRDIRYTAPETFAALVAGKRASRTGRRPWYSHSMIGLRRLENLEWCTARVFADGVPGDFLEAGVCQGGASIFMRALQVAHGEARRRMWVADSFQGSPVPTAEIDRDWDFTEGRLPWLAIGLTAVQDNFRTYDLLSAEVRFLPGWFNETLARAPIGRLAILRIDADLYTSTRDVLDALYDKVALGGFVIVDDYCILPCRRAVDSFRNERAITEPLRRVDSEAVYWRKAPGPTA